MNYLQRKKLAFMSIVNSVKGFVRNIIGVPPLTLSNCVDDKSLIDCKIYGNTIQKGLNLSEYRVGETVSGGLTWVVNSDRSITINGIPTVWSGLHLLTRPIDKSWCGSMLTLYYEATNSSNCAIVLNFYDSEGTRIPGDKLNYTLTHNTIHHFIVPENAVKITCSLQRVSNDVECTGTYYPMLLLGEYTEETLPEFAKTFPSPDNSIKIESVGEKTSNILDVATDSFVFNTRSYAQTSVSAVFERTPTGFKGNFYQDKTSVAIQVGYILGRTEDFKGKTITVSFDEAILNSGAKPIIGIYATSKQGVNIDKIDENTPWDNIIYGYTGGDTNERIGINDASYQTQFLITYIPEDIDSEAYPYLYTSFYVGYGADLNPAGSTFEYKGVQVQVSDSSNVFDASKATILKRLSDSTTTFDGDELVITKVSDTAQERTVITVPAIKKNAYMNVTVSGGDGTHQYGIYMTDAIPTSHTLITTHSANTENYNYINIIVIINTSTTGTFRYRITLNECGSGGYEPFGYKIPVIARGKNLFDTGQTEDYDLYRTDINFNISENILSAIAKSGATSIVHKKTKYASGTYSISGVFSHSPRFIVRLYNENNDLLDKTTVSISNWTYNAVYGGWFTNSNASSVTIPKDISYWTLGIVFMGDTGVEASCSDVQIERNGKTDYEPFIEPVTTNIYAKEPIRKIFNTLDAYTDIVDLANKKIVRNIASSNLESTSWISTADGKDGAYATQSYTVSTPIIDSGATINCFCENFIPIPRNNMFSFGQQGISASMNRIRLYHIGLTDLPDADFRAWVDENPIQVDYILAEPIEEIIDTSTMPTFKGTTIYEIGTTIQPSSVEVSYYSTQKE